MTEDYNPPATLPPEGRAPKKEPALAPASVPKQELNIEELKKKGDESKDSSSPVDISRDISRELEECQKLKDEYLAGWQRERADFLNYKKEELERIGEILKYTNVGLILNILPILDNFEIAEKKLPEDLKNDENVKGILQIKNQILDFLKNQGVEKIESLGKKFDPNLMEVVEVVEMKEKESAIVLEEIQKGYKINGRLLRPTKVKISK